MTVTYGYTVRWADRPGSETAAVVSGAASMEEAVREAVDMAIKAGWTPRRWWQWWRWGEVNPLAALERNP